MRHIIENLASLCSELSAIYVTICKHGSGAVTVTLQHDSDEGAAHSAAALGIVLTHRSLDNERWLGGSTHLADMLEVSVYGPHCAVLP